MSNFLACLLDFNRGLSECVFRYEGIEITVKMLSWPVNQVSVTLDPWHPKDLIIQVLQLGDQGWGCKGLIINPHINVVVRCLCGSIKSRYFLPLKSGVFYETFLCGKTVTQGSMCGTQFSKHILHYIQSWRLFCQGRVVAQL